MPLPLVPILLGAGVVGAVALGQHEKGSKGSSVTAGGSATASTQSTGGANGGAQAPSHADATPPPVGGDAPSGSTAPGGGTINPTAPGAVKSLADFGASVGGFTGVTSADLQKLAAAGVPTKTLESHAESTSGMTTQQLSTSFAKSGSLFGKVW